MTYTQTLAELERLKGLMKGNLEPKLRKHYKRQIKSLKKQRDDYEVSFYGEKLGE
jgi:hypothetical protein